MKYVCVLFIFLTCFNPDLFAASKVDPLVKSRLKKYQKKSLKRYKAPRNLDKRIKLALNYLASAQKEDGSWENRKNEGEFIVGCTSLTLMAFLASGHTIEEGDYEEVIEKAVNFLVSKVKEKGPKEKLYFDRNYGSGMVLLALSEYLLLDPEHDEVLESVERLSEYFIEIFNEKGWRYGSEANSEIGSEDPSITGWIIQGLYLADKTEADIWTKETQEKIKKGVSKYLATMLDLKTGMGRYENGGSLFSMPSWVSCFVFKLLKNKNNQFLKSCAKMTIERINVSYAEVHRDLYRMYWGNLAAFQLQGKVWQEWNKKIITPLVKKQIIDKEEDKVRGSWDPLQGKVSKEGGRVLATAMATLCLSTYYRYPVLK